MDWGKDREVLGHELLVTFLMILTENTIVEKLKKFASETHFYKLFICNLLSSVLYSVAHHKK